MYSYHYYNDFSGGDVAGLILFWVAFFVILGAGALISYLFRGFGMYSMAKNQGVPNGWMAFVPFARTYLQGELCGPIRLKNKEIKSPGLWLILAPIIFYAVFFAIYIGFIVMFVIQAAVYSSRSFRSEQLPPELMASLLLFLTVIVLIAIAGGSIISMLTGLVNYRIHKKYTHRNLAVMHMLLGLFVPLYQSIYFFFLRNKMPQFSQPAPVQAPMPRQPLPEEPKQECPQPSEQPPAEEEQQ